MGTYTSIIYQLVFGTKFRQPTLIKENRDELFKFITGVLKNKNCFLYVIGGVEDHIHIITHIHPSVALADLVKDIKLGSTAYIKEKNLFPDFKGWQEGYGAFTYSVDAKDNLIRYVLNQEEHHKKKNYKEELKSLLNEMEIEFEEKYLI